MTRIPKGGIHKMNIKSVKSEEFFTPQKYLVVICTTSKRIYTFKKKAPTTTSINHLL